MKHGTAQVLPLSRRPVLFCRGTKCVSWGTSSTCWTTPSWCMLRESRREAKADGGITTFQSIISSTTIFDEHSGSNIRIWRKNAEQSSKVHCIIIKNGPRNSLQSPIFCYIASKVLSACFFFFFLTKQL